MFHWAALFFTLAMASFGVVRGEILSPASFLKDDSTVSQEQWEEQEISCSTKECFIRSDDRPEHKMDEWMMQLQSLITQALAVDQFIQLGVELLEYLSFRVETEEEVFLPILEAKNV